MADDGATRTRRWKLHKAGDHSLCRRCDGRRPMVVVPVASGTPVDARASLEALAARLEAAHAADPGNAAVARVLKDTLLALGAAAVGDSGDDDPLAELRALAESVS
jgi:hypothetical protein